MPSLGGSGTYGGDDPTGGYSGALSGGDGGSAYSVPPGAGINMLSNDLSSFMGTLSGPNGLKTTSVEDAEKELANVLRTQATRGYSKWAAAIGGILLGVASGSIGLGIASGALIGKVFSAESVQKALSRMEFGRFTPAQATAALIEDNGGKDRVKENLKEVDSFGPVPESDGVEGVGGGEGNNDWKKTSPKSNKFWHDFTKEWQNAKENMQAQQDFRQEQLAPAFETYRNRLSGLSGEGTFKPINVKMGDFSTSFLPKRSAANAENILRSQLAETDIMDPQKANLSYLDKLYDLAKWQQQLKNKWQPQQNQPNDQGSWMDAASDTIGLASQASDLIDNIF